MTMRIRRAARSLPLWLKKPLRGLRASFVDIYASRSYSQEGEDMILQRIFSRQEFGFYVDVGAHHPRRFSNTCLFYRKGWRGINIEPNPDAGAAFQKERSRDINLQIGISDQEGKLTYHFFNDPAINSFDRELSDTRVEGSDYYRVIGTKEIAVLRLDTVLREHLPSGVTIDFLSIDVEGLDMAVLRSNDWDTFRPRVVLAEAYEMAFEDVLSSEVFHFMRDRGYQLLAKTVNTLIFALPSTQEHRL
jgi:FkbM family methyltransferase